MSKVLAIETSCDETACAILEEKDGQITVLANIVSSQAELHAAYGGVVPQLAAREHIKNIVPVIEEALHEASVTRDDIDFIAVTEGPGLMPALLVGVNAAKSLALAWNKPLMGVQHLEGHIYANLLPSLLSSSRAVIQSSYLWRIISSTKSSARHKMTHLARLSTK
jgi:N6-L-threonylcarbamoyladenine synthase